MIPQGVDHITLSGGLPGGERWAAGFWVEAATTGTAQQSAVLWRGYVDDGMVQNLRSIMSTTTTYSALTLYRYGAATGRITDKGQVSFNPVPGTGTGLNPDQISLVVTHRSALLLRAGRNRSYWPATGIAMAANGLFNTTPVDAFVDGFAGAILNGVPVCVSSSRSSFARMTSVDADYIPDQQTRRRRQLLSSRHSHVFT